MIYDPNFTTYSTYSIDGNTLNIVTRLLSILQFYLFVAVSLTIILIIPLLFSSLLFNSELPTFHDSVASTVFFVVEVDPV